MLGKLFSTTVVVAFIVIISVIVLRPPYPGTDLGIPNWPWTFYVAEDDLENLIILPLSDFLVLGL